MSRNTFCALATVLMVIVYIVTYRIDPEDYSPSVARFIPADALFSIEQRNGLSEIEAFLHSPLGKKVGSINFAAIRKVFGDSPILNDIEYGIKLLPGILENTFLDEMIGKHSAIAMLPALEPDNKNMTRQISRENFVLIAIPQYPVQILQVVAEYYAEHKDNISFSEKQYGTHVMQQVRVDGQDFYLSSIDGVILASVSERQLRHCIDTYDKENPSILSVKGYKALRAQFKKPDFFAYLPIENSREFALTHLIDESIPHHKIIAKELQRTKGFSGVGYGCWFHSSYFTDKTVINYDKTKVNPLAREYLEIQPAENNMLSLATGDPMFYYWSNAMNFKHFLMYVEDEVNSVHTTASAIKNIERVSGKSADEILSMLGEEVSVVIEPGKKGEIIPIPRVAALVRVDKKDDLLKIIDKVLNAYHVPMKEAKYGSAQYWYWMRSPQDGLQLLYGFWDNMFYIGNSTTLLQRIIDEKAKGTSLGNAPIVKKAGIEIEAENNSITYSNNSKLIELAKDLFNLLDIFIVLEDQHRALQVRTVIQEVITPILEGLAPYDSRVTRSYFKPDMAILESAVNVVEPQKNPYLANHAESGK